MSFDPFEIGRSIDILDLISNKYELDTTISGRVRYVSCPLPDSSDSNPSLAIFEKDNRFHCYHCGWNGTPIDFVMGMEGFTRPMEALAHLDKLYPELGVVNPEARTKATHVSKYMDMVENQVMKDHEELMGSDRYKEWVKTKRGFSEIAMKKFLLGVRDYSGVPRFIIPQTDNHKITSSLSRAMSPKDKLPRYFVRNISLHPESGKILKKEDMGMKGAIEIFRKGNYIYNLDDVKGDELILVEGQLDVIAGWEMGVDNMGAYGTMRVGDEQAAMLSRFQTITLIPDLGSALDVVIKNVETIRGILPDVSINIVDLSPWADEKIEGDDEFELKDVNDLFMYLDAVDDIPLFKGLVENAEPVELWLYSKEIAPLKGNAGAITAPLRRLLKLSTSHISRAMVVNKASKDLDIPVELLMKMGG